MRPRDDHQDMQVIYPQHVMRRVSRRRLVVGTLVGAILLVGGLSIGWLAFGTPFITSVTPTGRLGPSQFFAGMMAWTFALIAPAAFTIAGLARIVMVFDSVASAKPRPTPASRQAAKLGDDYVVAPRLRLPDGRLIPELVLGPFGAAVLEELPPAGATRRHGATWEVRASHGRWLPLENPLDRAARDAETVRTWFTHDDRDFLVKVYAAVISRDQAVERTANCAVISADQIPAWLASLPAQRSMTESRRSRLVELLHDPV